MIVVWDNLLAMVEERERGEGLLRSRVNIL